MKVEILYFSGCPNHPVTVDRVREVLRQEGAPTDFIEVEVKDEVTAQALSLLGSPTIRVNGQDIDPPVPDVSTCGMACRTYQDAGQRTGTPPLERIRAAVRHAREIEAHTHASL